MRLSEKEKYVLRRKTVHLAGSIYIVGIWLFESLFGLWNAGFLLVAIVMLGLNLYVSYNFLKFIRVPTASMENILRMLGSREFWEGEKYSFDVCWLALFISIGSVLSIMVGDVRIAYIMACTTFLGDGAATLAGVFLGKHHIPFNTSKTVEGSTAGFTIAFIASFLVTQSFWFAVVGVGVGMLVESLPWKLSDNATVPFLTTLALLLTKLAW